MKSMQIIVTFECDVCSVETADSSGLIPIGWKELAKQSPEEDIILTHIGPVCLASEDPEIIEAVRIAVTS